MYLPKSVYRGLRALKFVLWAFLGAAVAAQMGCSIFSGSKAAEEPVASTEERKGEPEVSVPWDSSGRDDRNAPVVRVTVFDNGANGVAVPHFYGYPLYAGGSAARGVLKLRQDNWSAAEQEQYQDADGVTHFKESFPNLGCVIEGIQETATRRVPLSLLCELPPPKALGGSRRPVLGELKTGARPDAVVMEPSVREAFMGEWHLTGEGFDSGEGDGYFDTQSGLLAFGFKRGKLVSVGYLFHPAEKRWQDPVLWIKP